MHRIEAKRHNLTLVSSKGSMNSVPFMGEAKQVWHPTIHE